MVRQLRYVPIIADTGAGVNTQKLRLLKKKSKTRILSVELVL